MDHREERTQQQPSLIPDAKVKPECECMRSFGGSPALFFKFGAGFARCGGVSKGRVILFAFNKFVFLGSIEVLNHTCTTAPMSWWWGSSASTVRCRCWSPDRTQTPSHAGHTLAPLDLEGQSSTPIFECSLVGKWSGDHSSSLRHSQDWPSCRYCFHSCHSIQPWPRRTREEWGCCWSPQGEPGWPKQGQKSSQGITWYLGLVLCENWQEGDCLRGEDAHYNANQENRLVAKLNKCPYPSAHHPPVKNE